MRGVGQFGSLILAVAAAGCLGGYQPGTPGTPGTTGTPATGGNGGGGGGGGGAAAAQTAVDLFNANVEPFLASNCSTCHAGTGTTVGPAFLGTGPADFLNKLTADPRFVNNQPATSLLLTKGAHEGPALTQAQGDSVTAWLTQDLVEHPTRPAPPANIDVAQTELLNFGACMTLTDFNSSGMADVHNQNTNNGTCDSCHQTGSYVLLAADATTTFNAMHTIPYLLKFAVADINPDGSFKDIVSADRFINRGKEPGHPAYTMATARATALKNFFTLSYTHYKAGNCPPQ